jgi:hypothetical protein
MEGRDVIIHVRKVKDTMVFRIMEGKEDIVKNVTQISFSLKDGRVTSTEMTLDDGSVWEGTFAPLS